MKETRPFRIQSVESEWSISVCGCRWQRPHPQGLKGVETQGHAKEVRCLHIVPQNLLPLPVMQLCDKNPCRQRLITDVNVRACVCAHECSYSNSSCPKKESQPFVFLRICAYPHMLGVLLCPEVKKYITSMFQMERWPWYKHPFI